jgi:MFS family permease
MTDNNYKKPRIFYGWWLMLVCMLIQAVGFGTSLYLYSVVIGAIGKDFPGSRFAMMIGVSGMLLLVGIMSPKIGSLLDRYPVKRVLIAGGVVMGIGFILMAFATNIYHVAGLYGLLIAFGMTVLSPLSCSLLLTRWFIRHRGLALGISALGTQLGGVAFPPIVASLIAMYDWRIAVASLGVFIIAFIPLLAWLFVFDHPEKKGLLPDGAPPEEAPDIQAAKEQKAKAGGLQPIKHILTSGNFIIVVAIITFASVIYSGILSNVSLIAVNKGETLEKGAVLVSLLSLAGMISSPLMGRFSDYLSPRQTLGILAASGVLALVLFHQAEDYTLLVAAVICFGFFGGAVVPVWSAVLSRLYDSRIYGRVLGASSAAVYSIAAFSAPTVGFLYDLTGSYQLTFLLLAGTMILLSLSILRLAAGNRDEVAQLREQAGH